MMYTACLAADFSNITLLPSGAPEKANVEYNEDKLVLSIDSTGDKAANARRLAKAVSLDTASVENTVVFDMTVNGNGTKAVGFTLDEDKPLFTVDGLSLCINGTAVKTLEENKQYHIAANAEYVFADGEKFDGTKETPAAGSKLYFSNLCGRTPNIKGVFTAENIRTYKTGDYKPVFSVADGAVEESVSEISVNFGAVLVKKPTVTVYKGEEKIESGADFKNTEMTISAAFEKGYAYSVNIGDIVTADGAEHEENIRFSVAPDGYKKPELSLSGIKELVRPGEALNLELGVESAYEIKELLLYINGTAEEVSAGAFEKSFENPGEYEIYAFASDILGGTGETEKYAVTVAENTPPVISFLNSQTSITLGDDIKFTVEDDMPYAYVSVFVNGEAADFSETDGICRITSALPIGDARIRVEATDSEGAYAELEKEFAISKAMSETQISRNTFDTGLVGLTYTSNAITPAAAKEGEENVLQLINSGTSTDPFQMALGVGTDEPIGASYDFKFNGTTAGASIAMVLRGSAAAEWPTIFNVSGSDLVLNGTEGNETKSGVFKKDEWYNIKYCADVKKGLYWMWLNGEMQTPASGKGFTGIASGKIDTLRIETRLSKSDMYFDNVTILRYSFCPSVTGIEADGDTIIVRFSDTVYINSDFAKKAELKLGDETTGIAEASANGNSIIIKTEGGLETAAEYLLIMPEDLTYAGNMQMGAKTCKYFTTQAADFDITDVHFTKSGNLTGAEAVITNKTGTAKSIVMVMIEKNENGAVTKVYSTAEETVEAGGNKILAISPAAQGTAEVFFIESWSNVIAIKNAKYKK